MPLAFNLFIRLAKQNISNKFDFSSNSRLLLKAVTIFVYENATSSQNTLEATSVLSLLSTERKGFLRSEHALLIRWLSQAHQVLSQKSRGVFYFLSVRATKFIQGNTDSIAQHTVLGSNVVLKA